MAALAHSRKKNPAIRTRKLFKYVPTTFPHASEGRPMLKGSFI